MNGKYIVGLDIGTTKVCVTVGRVRRDEPPMVMGVGLVPSSGIEKGMVVDMRSTAEAVRFAVEQAELSSGVQIRAVYVGIAGAHVDCMESYGATGIKGRLVSDEDRQRSIESASAVFVPLDRSVLHILPMDFTVDGQGGIADPIGMSGVRLEVNVCVVTASQAALENLVRCCELAGLSVIDTVFEPLASSRAVLRHSELRSGVAVIDMGGGTTDVAVYRGGGLRHASVLPVGGRHFTRDLAIGLRLPEDEAERIKKQYGYAVGGTEGPRSVEVTDDTGKQRTVHREDMWEIILPRTEEVFDLVGDEIQSVLRYAPSSSIVLTGGAALLEGMDRVAEARLGIPARIGLPVDVADAELRKTIESPVCSTAVGLMLYGIESERNTHGDLLGGIRGRLQRIGQSLVGLRQKTFGFLNI